MERGGREGKGKARRGRGGEEGKGKARRGRGGEEEGKRNESQDMTIEKKTHQSFRFAISQKRLC